MSAAAQIEAADDVFDPFETAIDRDQALSILRDAVAGADLWYGRAMFSWELDLVLDDGEGGQHRGRDD